LHAIRDLNILGYRDLLQRGGAKKGLDAFFLCLPGRGRRRRTLHCAGIGVRGEKVGWEGRYNHIRGEGDWVGGVM